MNEFPGFVASDFDAYEAHKWSSNRFNLPRMQVRERVEQLAALIVQGLGASMEGLVLGVSQDHPTIFNNKKVDAQRVWWGRSPEQRKELAPLIRRERSRLSCEAEPQPHHAELNVGLAVNFDGVDISLRLHPSACLDRANAQALLKDAGRASQLLALLQGLPDSVVMDMEAERVACAALTVESIAAGLEGLQPDSPAWYVGCRFTREDEALTLTGFAGVAQALLESLLPVYRMICWSPENDAIGGVDYLATERERVAVSPEKKPETTESSGSGSKQGTGGRRKSEKPSTRGGWSYRPDWQESTPSTAEREVPKTPSARVRERVAELSSRAENWRYAPPARESNTAPTPRSQPARTSEQAPSRKRSEKTERRSGRPGGGRPGGGRSGGRSDQRDHRRDRGGRSEHRGRDRQSGRGGKPATTKARKVTEWKDAEGDVDAMDHVRIAEGLFSGQVGCVVSVTRKGFKVAVGEMVVEVSASSVSRVTEA